MSSKKNWKIYLIKHFYVFYHYIIKEFHAAEVSTFYELIFEQLLRI